MSRQSRGDLSCVDRACQLGHYDIGIIARGGRSSARVGVCSGQSSSRVCGCRRCTIREMGISTPPRAGGSGNHEFTRPRLTARSGRVSPRSRFFDHGRVTRVRGRAGGSQMVTAVLPTTHRATTAMERNALRPQLADCGHWPRAAIDPKRTYRLRGSGHSVPNPREPCCPNSRASNEGDQGVQSSVGSPNGKAFSMNLAMAARVTYAAGQ